MKIKSGEQFACNRKANKSIDLETLGLAYGFLGVLVFSLTLPATRLAVALWVMPRVGVYRVNWADGMSFVGHWSCLLFL